MAIWNLNKKPTIDFLDTIIAGSAGDEMAMKELALHIATSTIADLIGRCKVRVFKHGEEVKDDFTYAMNVSPNPNMSAARMWQTVIQKSYDIDSGAILIPITAGNGSVSYLVADDYQVDFNPLGEHQFHNIMIGETGEKTISLNQVINEGDLFRFKFENASLRTYVNSMYQEYGELMSFAMNNYKNKNGSKFLWKTNSSATGDADADEKNKSMVKEALRKYITTPNSVLPIFNGQDLVNQSEKTSTDSNDIRMIRKDIFDTIAQIFKIPQSVFYGNITNADQVFNEMITLVIAPHATVISQELTRKTINLKDYKKGSYVMLDPSTIKVQDILQLSNGISTLIGSGAFSPNDIREKLGEQKINEPWADKYYMTKNYSLADNIAKETNEPSNMEGEKQ